MGKKLTLERLAAYLPYGLQWTLQDLKIFTMSGITESTLFTEQGTVLYWEKHKDLPQALFPILRPLSNLTKEIEHNGERFVPINELEKLCQCDNDRDWIEHFHDYYPQEVEWEFAPYWMVKKLFEWHFDLNELIESGLAIDINTLN